MRPPMTGNFLEIPFSKSLPSILGSIGFTAVAWWCNNEILTVKPNSLSPAFLAEAAEKNGVAVRGEAPPVFLNPIRRNIPGNILGPEDYTE